MHLICRVRLQLQRHSRSVRLTWEFPLRVDDVQNDDGVVADLHEDYVRELAHNQLACSGYAVAFADPFGIGGKRFNFPYDAPFDRRRGPGAGFEVVIGEDFLEVVDRLVRPEDVHR